MRDFEFDAAFKALTGHAPFPWQRRLFERYFSRGKLPSAVDIPTGLGKTAVMAVWLLARACGAPLPRRLVYVVDRRAVVDQATDYAERLRGNLERPELASVRRGLNLRRRKGLPISTLRGRYADNREWLDDPAAPAVIVGTVDMIGSRLLFEGYAVSRRMRPYAAGLLGCDTLVLLDEAHLSRPFRSLLQTIERETAPATAESDGRHGMLSGPAARPGLPPPFRVLPLSATLGGAPDAKPFGLDWENGADRDDATVRKRLEARKLLTVENLGGAKPADALADRAWRVAQEECGRAGKPVRALIYCDRRKDAEEIAKKIEKRVKESGNRSKVILFVGGRRIYEREEAADDLRCYGFIGDSEAAPGANAFLVATSAGEVGVDLDADHMVCDLVEWERMVQRLGRVNRRGADAARVLVLDGGPSDEKNPDAVKRHEAARQLLAALPLAEGGGHSAGPAALNTLRGNPSCREALVWAPERPPLYPLLSRALVDAWSMTSLREHAGRPEVGPWLRGWINDEPQTTLIWRKYLPVRFERSRRPAPRDVEEFFEAAPPHATEMLETETYRAVTWLQKRAEAIMKKVDGETATPADIGDNGGDSEVEESEGEKLLPKLTGETPVVFRFASNGAFEKCMTVREVADLDAKDKKVHGDFSGRRVAVDARTGGLVCGLLDTESRVPAVTIEDGVWPRRDGGAEAARPPFRVRLMKNDLLENEREHADSTCAWHKARMAPLQVSPEGEAEKWLVVEKAAGSATDEDTLSVATKPQRLDEHQEWVATEARRIACEMRLDEAFRDMLVAAARHHDDGKAAPLWQRAFNAPGDAPSAKAPDRIDTEARQRRWREGDTLYAKTAGPIDRRLLNGYRHEFQSTLDAQERGPKGMDCSDDACFDLALHLIAAHHGRARPSMGIEGCESLPPTAAARKVREIALRFARLQRQWGPWGLAWWEALLRAADQRASRCHDNRRSVDSARVDAARSVALQSRQPDLFTGARSTD